MIGRVGPVAYYVQLLEHLARVHNAFDISMLRQSVGNPDIIIQLSDDVEVFDDAKLIFKPQTIVGRDEKTTSHSTIRIIKVRWSDNP